MGSGTSVSSALCGLAEIGHLIERVGAPSSIAGLKVSGPTESGGCGSRSRAASRTYVSSRWPMTDPADRARSSGDTDRIVELQERVNQLESELARSRELAHEAAM